MLSSRRNGWSRYVTKENRLVMAALLLGLVAMIPLPACIGLWFAQQAACWDNAHADWEAATANWPDVAVRIVNNTDATARVVLTPAGIFTANCDFGLFGGWSDDPNYMSADDQSLLVAGNGTATGTVKCGEIIAVTVRAPYDVWDDSSYYGWYDSAYGLYLDAGNVAMSGAGVTSDNDFSGDTVSLIRYVRQVEDGLDCASDTLVITIETLGTARVVDQETGAIISSGTPGTGEVSIE